MPACRRRIRSHAGRPALTDRPIQTTTAGSPIADNQNSLTAGSRGPVLMQDWQLIEKLAHQNRERIPERVVHAKGAGGAVASAIDHSASGRGFESTLQRDVLPQVRTATSR